MWLTNCRIVDVLNGGLLDEPAIEVIDGVIARIDSGPQTGDVIDLRGQYVIPGLVTCHAHLAQVYPFEATDRGESPATTVLRALGRARDSLLAGVTSLRSVSEMHAIDIPLRDAGAAGWVEIPRILAGGRGLTITGGHGSHFGSAVVADGADEFLAAARREISLGADHVKIFITGGIAEAGENLGESEMTVEEVRSVVTAAQQAGKYVVAHAAASQPIVDALAAGVRSFEHAYHLDESAARTMAQEGAFLGPTLSVTRLPDFMRAIGFTEWQIAHALTVGDAHLESIRTAIRCGVTLVNSTDYPPGGSVGGTSVVVNEMHLMVTAGLSPLEALQASTINGARLCRIGDVAGSVSVGKSADLIVVRDDPTNDVSALEAMQMIMARGSFISSAV